MLRSAVRSQPETEGKPNGVSLQLEDEDGSSVEPHTFETAVPNWLAGDFNATLDQSEFRDVLGRGYYDAAERMGDRLNPTWPAIRGRPLPAGDDRSHPL
jgi:hypothetical protein